MRWEQALRQAVGRLPQIRFRARRPAEPSQLPVVLDQSQFVEHLTDSGLARAGKQCVHAGVEAGQDYGVSIAPGFQVTRQIPQRPSYQTEHLLGVGWTWHVANPESAMQAAGEVCDVPRRCVVPNVDDSVMPEWIRCHHQNRVGDRLSGQPGEGARRPKRVFGVVGAGLQRPGRDNDELAGKRFGDGRPAPRGERRTVRPGGMRHGRCRVPIQRDRRLELIGHRDVV